MYFSSRFIRQQIYLYSSEPNTNAIIVYHQQITATSSIRKYTLLSHHTSNIKPSQIDTIIKQLYYASTRALTDLLLNTIRKLTLAHELHDGSAKFFVPQNFSLKYSHASLSSYFDKSEIYPT